LGWLAGLFPGADKVVHLGLYSVLGLLTSRALLLFREGPVLVRVLAAAMIGTTYGALDEVHQMFVAGRTAEVLDLVADAAGSLLGAAAWAWLVLRRRG